MTARRRWLLLLLIAGAIAAAWLIPYERGGSTLIATQRSPDGREQVQLYSATRWQAMWQPNADLLGFATLSRVADGRTVATSSAFEMSGEGEVFWTKDGVQVGSSAVFDRATGRWSVQQ